MRKLLSMMAIASTLAVSVPAFAQGDVQASSTTTATVATSADLACMSAAVLAREDAIIAARTTFNTSSMAALSARRDGLRNAYTIANSADRRTALKAVWTTFNTSLKNARTAYKTSINASWKTFVTASAQCGTAIDRSNNNKDDENNKEHDKHGNRGLHLGQMKQEMESDLKINGDARIDLSL